MNTNDVGFNTTTSPQQVMNIFSDFVSRAEQVNETLNNDVRFLENSGQQPWSPTAPGVTLKPAATAICFGGESGLRKHSGGGFLVGELGCVCLCDLVFRGGKDKCRKCLSASEWWSASLNVMCPRKITCKTLNFESFCLFLVCVWLSFCLSFVYL